MADVAARLCGLGFKAKAVDGPSTHQGWIWFQRLALGIFVHGTAVYFLGTHHGLKPFARLNSVPIQVYIQHSKTETDSPASALSKPSASSKSRQPVRSNSTESISHAKRPQIKTQTYEHFLPLKNGSELAIKIGPGGARVPSFAQHNWNAAYSGQQKQDLLLEAGSLAGHFDLPLSYRKIGVQQQAFARISYNPALLHLPNIMIS